jgi:outer membrane protein insertion porin family
MRSIFFIVGLLWGVTSEARSAASPVAASYQVRSIEVSPESESRGVLAALPFKIGGKFEDRFVDVSKRLLVATEKYDRVEVLWDSESETMRIRVEPRLYFEGIKWAGDRFSDESSISRICVLASEPRSMSQERLSQISRCIVGQLNGLGFLDASAIINPDGGELEIELLLGKAYYLSNVEIVGVEPNRREYLWQQLQNRKGWPYESEKLTADTETIRSDLLYDGFFFAEVFQPSVQVFPAEHKVALQWRVRRGRKFDVRFLGDYTSSKPLHELLSRGETLPQWFIEEIEDQILSDLRGKGYLDASVEVRRKDLGDQEELIRFITDRGPLYRLEEAEFVGVSNAEDVTRVFSTISGIQRGSAFKRQEFKGLVEDDFLNKLYSKGFLDLQLRSIDFSVDRESARVKPLIYMTDGERYTIGSARFEGLNSSIEAIPEFKDLRALVRTGLPVDRVKIDSQKDVLKRVLVAAGYLDADVVIGLEKSGRLADLNIQVITGPLYRISNILIRGARRTREEILLAEISIERGDIFTEEAKRDAIANVLRLGIARSIDVRVLERIPEDSEVMILVDLVEAARFRFEIGPGYGTQDGLRGVFKGAYANIGGTGRRLSLFAKANRQLESSSTPTDVLDPRPRPFIERNVTIEYLEPRIFSFPVDGGLTFQNLMFDTRQYGLLRNKFGARLDYRLNRRWQFSTQYALEFRDPFNVGIGFNTPFEDETNKTLTSIEEIINYQHVDDEFNPIKGIRTRLEGTLYHERLGGDENFWQTKIKQDLFYPLWTKGKNKIFGSGLSVNLGFSDDIGASQAIPVEKRFYVGGEYSVRGFDDQTINPPNEIGGKSFFFFQSEVFVPMFGGVDLLGFFDGGNAYRTNKEWEPWDLRYGAGVGLRWQTPVGPLKVGYGFNLARRVVDGAREPLGAFYFGVGTL